MALLALDKRSPKLLLPHDNHTILRPETFEDGFTQSEIGTWDDCAEKWYLGYNQRLARRGSFEWHFVYGDAVHETLADFYRDGTEKVAPLQIPDGVDLTADQEREFERWQAVLQVQMSQYWHYRADDLEAWTPWAVEETMETEFEGIKLRGKIDLGHYVDCDPDTDILTDHKTFGLDDYEGWQFRFQFMFYVWLTQKATGRKIKQFMVNGVRKPQLQWTKKETLQGYANRVRQAMIQEPTKFFVRHPLHMLKNSMEHFETRVLRPKLNRIALLTQDTTPAIIIESLARNQNTHNCVAYGSCCEFLPICKHGANREQHFYHRRSNKHNELAPLQKP